MTERTPEPLRDRLRDRRYAAWIEQTELIAAYEGDVAERIAAAKLMITRINLERVFDQYTPEQEKQLFSILDPIAVAEPPRPTPLPDNDSPRPTAG